jgi:hypothetical protein
LARLQRNPELLAHLGQPFHGLTLCVVVRILRILVELLHRLATKNCLRDSTPAPRRARAKTKSSTSNLAKRHRSRQKILGNLENS